MVEPRCPPALLAGRAAIEISQALRDEVPGEDVIDGQGGSDTVAGNQGIDVIADPASEIDENFVLSAALLTALEAIG